MDTRTVDNWIDSYVLAWQTKGTSVLKDIFSEDVTYQVSPFKPPMHGLKELAPFWEKSRSSEKEEFKITHDTIAIEEDVAVIKVHVTYADPPEEWKDLWIVTFDGNGLCTNFEEWPFHPEQDDGHKLGS